MTPTRNDRTTPPRVGGRLTTAYRADDPCADNRCLVPPAEFVRLRYYFGQRLGVVDFADEQSYLVGKQRFHNLRLHGAGVLCGLRAERFVFPQGSPATTATTLLRVGRGAALDWCGREIVVGWDQCIDVAAWFAQHPEAQQAAAATDGPLRLWVALCYRECPSDPGPAPRDPCGCESTGCEYARIREGFELKLLLDAAAAEAGPPADSDSGTPVAAEEQLNGDLATAYERLAALLGSADCHDAHSDWCLLLANFQATFDATRKTVVDITAPDNTIPERRTLLPTSILQRGVIEALAAAGEAGLAGPGPRLSSVTFSDAGADSGTLNIAVATAGSDLPKNPFTAPKQLAVAVSQFKDDGSWADAPAFTPDYVAGASPSVVVKWAAGSGLGEGRYRVRIEGDRKTPAVDGKMRPLAPLPWARHIRLVKNSTTGNLELAPSLY